MEKVLIIKAGYSEFLDKESDSRNPSLGDVLRTTPLLYLFKNDHVTWVTDEKAIPLLEKNPFIDRLLRLDFLTLQRLEHEYFDTIINLEKIPGICAFTKKIGAWRSYGFRFDPKTGEVKAHDKAYDALIVGSNPEIKKQNKRTYQELLFDMLGEKWNKEEYILGYTPKSGEIYDVALNTIIGHKWPTKAWPKEYWEKIEKTLREQGFTVTRQDKQDPEILTNLNNYMDWINSARLIISNDSLGMHLGIALKKRVIGLFGSTPPEEVYFYERGMPILPDPKRECIPCFNPECERERSCMHDITPESVLNEAKTLLNKSPTRIVNLSVKSNVIFIYGPPAVGKLTVAQELSNLLNYKIFHDHHIQDSLSSVFEIDGDSWCNLRSDLKLKILKQALENKLNIVTTHCYSHPRDNDFINQLIEIIEKNNANIFFVRLFCSKEEQQKRVLDESRRKWNKIHSIEELEKAIEKHNLNEKIPFVKSLEIDNSFLSPQQTVSEISRYYEI